LFINPYFGLVSGVRVRQCRDLLYTYESVQNRKSRHIYQIIIAGIYRTLEEVSNIA